MALDVLANYAEATTSAGGTTASTSDTAITVASIAGSFPVLTAGVTQLRVMDKAQLGAIGGEVMVLTADAGGAPGSWTVTRAVEGTLSAHAAGWVMVPVTTAGGLTAQTATLPTAPCIPQFPRSGYQLVNFYALDGSSQSNVAASNGVAELVPFHITKACTVTSLNIKCDALGSAGAVMRLAVYADGGAGVPDGSPLIDQSVDVSPTAKVGVIQTAVSLTLEAGTYWFATVLQGAPATAPTFQAAGNYLVPIAGWNTAAGALAGDTAHFWVVGGITGAWPAMPGAFYFSPSSSANPAGRLATMTVQ